MDCCVNATNATNLAVIAYVAYVASVIDMKQTPLVILLGPPVSKVSQRSEATLTAGHNPCNVIQFD